MIGSKSKAKSSRKWIAGALALTFAVVAGVSHYSLRSENADLRAQLEAYQAAEGIVRLHGLAEELRQLTDDYCGMSFSMLGSNGSNVQQAMEGFGYHYVRDDIPVERTIAAFQALKENNVTVISTNEGNVVAQFFDDPQQGKVLALATFSPPSGSKEKQLEFIETLIESEFSLGATDEALTRALLHERKSGFFEIEGAAGQSQIAKQDGEFKIPIGVMAGPKC